MIEHSPVVTTPEEHPSRPAKLDDNSRRTLEAVRERGARLAILLTEIRSDLLELAAGHPTAGGVEATLARAAGRADTLRELAGLGFAWEIEQLHRKAVTRPGRAEG